MKTLNQKNISEQSIVPIDINKSPLSQWMKNTAIIIIFMMILSANLFAQTTTDLVNYLNSWNGGSPENGSLSANAVGDLVTVTGTVNNIQFQQNLILNIPLGVTVEWKATTRGANWWIELTADSKGTLDIVEGVIEDKSNQEVIIIEDPSESTVKVNGGTVLGSIGSNSSQGRIEIIKGLVQNESIYAGAVISSTGGEINISGGLMIGHETVVIIMNDVTLKITGGILKSTFANPSPNSVVQNLSSNPVIMSGGLLYSNSETAGWGGSFTLTENAVAIGWDKINGQPSYPAGSSDDLHVRSEGNIATAEWSIEDGKHGISYTNGTVTDFIEVPEVTVLTPVDALLEQINNWQHGGTGSLTATPNNDGDLVTVTGDVTAVENNLILTIPQNVKIEWGASISGNIWHIEFSEDSAGEIEILSPARLERTNNAEIIQIKAQSFTKLHLNGGTVLGRIKSVSENATIVMSRGKVSADQVLFDIDKSFLTINDVVLMSKELANPMTIAFGSMTSGVLYTESLTYYEGSWDINTLDALTISGDVIKILRNSAENQSTPLVMNTRNNLYFQPETATVYWNIQEGKSGITYKNGTNEGFFEVEGITVITEIEAMLGTIRAFPTGQTDKLIATVEGSVVTISSAEDMTVQNNQNLTLNIPHDVIVKWEANVSGAQWMINIPITGSGTLEIVEGGYLKSEHTNPVINIISINITELIIDGGEVIGNIRSDSPTAKIVVNSGLAESITSSPAISLNNGSLEIKGGEVRAFDQVINHTSGSLQITGGLIKQSSPDADQPIISTTSGTMTGGLLFSHAPSIDYGNLNLSGNAFAVAWDYGLDQRNYIVGSNEHLTVAYPPSGAAAIWNIMDNKNGITYYSDEYENFIQITEVTLTNPVQDLINAITQWNHGGTPVRALTAEYEAISKTVTVDGTVTGAGPGTPAYDLSLIIPTGVTVKWNASVSGLWYQIILADASVGTLEITDQSEFSRTFTNGAIFRIASSSTSTLSINGGKVYGSLRSDATGGTIEIKGGLVQNFNTNYSTISMGEGKLNIIGGVVESGTQAAVMAGAGVIGSMTGGLIRSNTGHIFNGPSTLTYPISGGALFSKQTTVTTYGISLSDNAVQIGWDAAKNTGVYALGSRMHLHPDYTGTHTPRYARWEILDGKTGISYANGDNNTGFIEIGEVDLVSGIDYLIATINNWNHGVTVSEDDKIHAQETDDNQVTVTGNVSGISWMADNLELRIPADVTLIWNANLSGYPQIVFTEESAGTMLIGEGVKVQTTGTNSLFWFKTDSDDSDFCSATTLHINGGEVLGMIYTEAKDATILLTEGLIEYYDDNEYSALIGLEAGKLIIEGGKVNTNSIAINSLSGGSVEIKGGIISNKTGHIILHDDNVTMSGGVLFSEKESVTTNPTLGVTLDENAILIGWDKQTPPITYLEGYTTNLKWDEAVPEDAVVEWGFLDDKQGIYYEKGTNKGIIELEGVTVKPPLQALLETINNWEPGGTGELKATNVDNTVTVRGDVTTSGTRNLSLTIPPSVTVIWEASVSGQSFQIQFSEISSGIFELVEGAELNKTGSGAVVRLSAGSATHLKINGGTVKGEGIYSISENATIEIIDGYIESPAFAINIDAGHLKMSGGTVKSTNDDRDTIFLGGAFPEHGRPGTGSAEITGGIIHNSNFRRVINNAGSGSATISNAVVFSGNAPDTNSMWLGFTLFENTILIAWNSAAGAASYTEGEDDDIDVFFETPAANDSVEWGLLGGKTGIRYTNGDISGIIELDIPVATKIQALVDYINNEGGAGWNHGGSGSIVAQIPNPAEKTVTVEGNIWNANQSDNYLKLNIPKEVTVVWTASISGWYFTLEFPAGSSGIFNMVDGVLSATNVAQTISFANVEVNGSSTLLIIDGGTVNRGIYSGSHDATVEIRSGKVSGTVSRALQITRGKFIISGGLVENTGTENAIYLQSSNPDNVISGGVIRSEIAQVINVYSTPTGLITMTGGVLFTTSEEVTLPANGLELIADALAFGYNSSSPATVYASGSRDDILVAYPDLDDPVAEAEVYWSEVGGDFGIRYIHGGNFGFIEIPGVTVSPGVFHPVRNLTVADNEGNMPNFSWDAPLSDGNQGIYNGVRIYKNGGSIPYRTLGASVFTWSDPEFWDEVIWSKQEYKFAAIYINLSGEAEGVDIATWRRENSREMASVWIAPQVSGNVDYDVTLNWQWLDDSFQPVTAPDNIGLMYAIYLDGDIVGRTAETSFTHEDVIADDYTNRYKIVPYIDDYEFYTREVFEKIIVGTLSLDDIIDLGEDILYYEKAYFYTEATVRAALNYPDDSFELILLDNNGSLQIYGENKLFDIDHDYGISGVIQNKIPAVLQAADIGENNLQPNKGSVVDVAIDANVMKFVNITELELATSSAWPGVVQSDPRFRVLTLVDEEGDTIDVILFDAEYNGTGDFFGEEPEYWPLNVQGILVEDITLGSLTFSSGKYLLVRSPEDFMDPATDPPLPAINPSPPNVSTPNVNLDQILSWERNPNGEKPRGYKVYFGTDYQSVVENSVLQLVAENSVLQTTWTPTGANALEYDTTYYWKVVPENRKGPAEDCPIWSFTTMEDPVITLVNTINAWGALFSSTILAERDEFDQTQVLVTGVYNAVSLPSLILNIPKDVTVKWEAKVTVNNLILGIPASSSGIIEIGANGRLEKTETSPILSIQDGSSTTVKLNGGELIGLVRSDSEDAKLEIIDGSITGLNGQYAIDLRAGELELIGGLVRGEQIVILVSSGAEASIDGGVIQNSSTGPIIVTYPGGTTAMTGGVLFSSSGAVSYSGFTLGSEVITIGWNNPTGKDLYASETAEDLLVNHSGAAFWDFITSDPTKYGISYSRGANTGFFEVAGVVVKTAMQIFIDSVEAWVPDADYPLNRLSAVQTGANEVTIDGDISSVTSEHYINLKVPDGLTVKWNASVISENWWYINIIADSKGTFELESGVIDGACFDLHSLASTTFKVNGGTMLNGYILSNSIVGLVEISAGLVQGSSNHSAVIYISNSHLVVSGGEVRGTKTAVQISSNGSFAMDGGFIQSVEGFAVDSDNDTNANMSDGVLFSSGAFVAMNVNYSGDAIGVRWNKTPGTTEYTRDTSEDISVISELGTASAVWGREGSIPVIRYANGTNTGYIEIDADLTILEPYPLPVVLGVPSAGAVNVPLRPTFTWTNPADADSWTDLKLYISEDVDFETYEIISLLAVKDAGSYTLSVSEALHFEKTYQWKIVPQNTRGENPDPTVRSFTTLDEPLPLNVTLLLPLNDASDEPLRPTFTWENNAGEPTNLTGLWLYVSDEETTVLNVTNRVSIFSEIASGEYTLTENLTQITEYFWTIVPENSKGLTENPIIRSFTTIDYPVVFNLPIIDFQGSTENFGDTIQSSMLNPASDYLNGYDYLFEFEIQEESVITASISGTNSGLFIVKKSDWAEMAQTAAQAIAGIFGSNGGSQNNIRLGADRYIGIVSSQNDFIDFTLNISALRVEEFSIDKNEIILEVGQTLDSFIVVNNRQIDTSTLQFVLGGVNSNNFTLTLLGGQYSPSTPMIRTLGIGETVAVNIEYIGTDIRIQNAWIDVISYPFAIDSYKQRITLTKVSEAPFEIDLDEDEISFGGGGFGSEENFSLLNMIDENVMVSIEISIHDENGVDHTMHFDFRIEGGDFIDEGNGVITILANGMVDIVISYVPKGFGQHYANLVLRFLDEGGRSGVSPVRVYRSRNMD